MITRVLGEQGSSNNSYAKQVVSTDEDYKLAVSDQQVMAIKGLTLTLPDNPYPGEEHLLVADAGGFIFVVGGAFPIEGGNPTVEGSSALQLVFSINQKWIVVSRASSQALTFIYRPGDLNPSGNVFNSWDLLMAAKADVQGLTVIEVDSSIVGIALVPAGIWNLDDTTLVGANRGKTPLVFDTLQFEEGATITSNNLAIQNNLEVIGNSSSPIWEMGNADMIIPILALGLLVTLEVSPGKAPFIHVPGIAAPIINVTDAATIGNGTTNVISVDAGANLELLLTDNAVLEPHAIGGVGTVTLFFSSDAEYQLPQDNPGIVPGMSSDASRELYTPSVLADWSGVAPTSVSDALDRIAAKITPVP